jgi:hypothetical protein
MKGGASGTMSKEKCATIQGKVHKDSQGKVRKRAQGKVCKGASAQRLQ